MIFSVDNMCELNQESLQDLINIHSGLFAPLTGFMTEEQYRSVIDRMLITDTMVWTLPVTLDVDNKTFIKLSLGQKLNLTYNAKVVGTLLISSLYSIQEGDILKIYKTTDINHPGVKKEIERNKFRIGGDIEITDTNLLKNNLNPITTKEEFEKRGWKTIVGFQTRNPVHRAHEHLHRTALELLDGLFINPLTGWKKKGDFSEEAVIDGYKAIIDNYYSQKNVYFDVLKTPMRYAGPREAVFHALIRKNLGCTHFIIGRDHAGVGNYYGIYEAQELAMKLSEKYGLGIEILCLKEPIYCKKCEMVVSEKHCNHGSEELIPISGTKIRNMLQNGIIPDQYLMRKEVAQAIISLGSKMFIS